MTLSLGLSFVLSFFLGSIPSGYIIVRVRTGRDIRSLGSGNVGATNVFRAVGKQMGICVLLLDAMKGYLAVVLCGSFGVPEYADPVLVRFLIGVTAVLGHAFTPFLHFKGGKGVATSAGVGLALFPLEFTIAMLVWSLALFLSRYMSVASLLASYAFTGTAFCLWHDTTHQILALSVSLFITWTHRENLKRLSQGTENRFSISRPNK